MYHARVQRCDLSAIDTWEQLLSDAREPLRAAAAEADRSSVTDISRLRRTWDQTLVNAALELAEARRKALTKFPNHPNIVADVAGVEQASSSRVAAHKAQRFMRTGASYVHDLCCGIGGDAMELARIAEVTAVDRDPLRTWMTSHNAPCSTHTTDVSELDLTGAGAFHIDPARRDADTGRRAWRYENYKPGPDAIERLIEQCPHAAVKLGPGIDLESLPLAEREIELISEGGRLVQAVMWTGNLALHPGRRTATLLPDGASMTGTPTLPPIAHPGKYLYEPDASLERSQLLGALCDAMSVEVGELHPGIGLLTSDARIDSPWLRCYEIVDLLPWRQSKILDALRSHDTGLVAVKTRGVQENPDQLQAQLRGSGDVPHIVFVTRFGERRIAIITTLT